MKRLLTTLVILTGLFAPSLAVGGEGVKLSDLVVREGLRYVKFTEEPFTGKTTGEWQITFRRGIFHGPSVTYYENGQLRWKGTYKDGKAEGPSVAYYPTSQLYWKGTYKDGEREGPWVFYKWDDTKDMDGKDAIVTELGEHEGTGTYRNGKKVSD